MKKNEKNHHRFFVYSDTLKLFFENFKSRTKFSWSVRFQNGIGHKFSPKNVGFTAF